jgi:hypothetical protein
VSTLQKAITLTFGVALITVLTLPNRQTVPVANAVFNGSRGILATAMGTGKTV